MSQLHTKMSQVHTKMSLAYKKPAQDVGRFFDVTQWVAVDVVHTKMSLL